MQDNGWYCDDCTKEDTIALKMIIFVNLETLLRPVMPLPYATQRGYLQLFLALLWTSMNMYIYTVGLKLWYADNTRKKKVVFMG